MSGINPNKNLIVNKEFNKKIEVYNIFTPPAGDISFNMVDEPCYLNGFMCESIFSGINAKRIGLYDVSGIPDFSNNATDKKFGFLLSDSFPINQVNFPKDGIPFNNGIGVICKDEGGGGSISKLETSFFYTYQNK